MKMTQSSSSRSPSPPASSKKRKRNDLNNEELEVDIAAPEPPSKKALRKAKKGKIASTKSESKLESENKGSIAEDEGPKAQEESLQPKRSEHGIWIGNLPWSASKTDLRTFLTSNTNVSEEMITRIHMPPPKETNASSRAFAKPQNRGFAYVDFSTQPALDEAISLSETLLTGRRVLIKNSKSFEGRPEKSSEEQNAAKTDTIKPPSKRIFVGNLDFDATKEGIKEHFSKCGEVLDVHLATFEDSGKCKGYGWVEFETIEAGQAAIRGWIQLHQDLEQSDDAEEGSQEEAKSRSKRRPKVRKWWVNRFQGRPLRMEFAEAKEVRYKKRYGKNTTSQQEASPDLRGGANVAEDTLPKTPQRKPDPTRVSGAKSTAELGFTDRPMAKRRDARTIAPGAALAAAPRLQGSIVASKGKKTVLA